MKQEFYRTKEEIEDWLNKHNIANYTLISDEKYGYVVDVDGSVIIDFRNETVIPIKFNIINGDFDITGNKIKTLNGCPKVVNGDFSCSYCYLTSLEFCPDIVTGSFWCDHNDIENLLHFPKNNPNSFMMQENRKLGKLQNEKSSKILYKAHLDCVSEFEYNKINSIINKENQIIKKNKI